VADYRQAVLTAFQSVEDSLSSWNHLQQETQAYATIYQRNQTLYEHTRAQREVGTASEQSLKNEQLTLLSARQNLMDSQASLAQSSVTLIKNLGGGWQWDESREAPTATTSRNQSAGTGPAESLAAQ
jgi:outer membrane protein TolC